MKKKQLKKLLKAAEASAQAQPIATVPNDRPLADWLDVHEQQIRTAGYAPQTVKNRVGILRHIRRLWGTRGIRSLKAHEIATAIRAEFLPDNTSTAQRVLGELRMVYSEAVANDWCDTSPAMFVKMPKHRVMRERLKFETWHRMWRRSQDGTWPRWVEAMLLLGLVIGQRRADLSLMTEANIVTAADGQEVLQFEQQKKAGKEFGSRLEIPLSLRMDEIGMTVGDVIEVCRACAKPGPNLLRMRGGRSISKGSLSTRFHELIVMSEGRNAYARRKWPSLHEVRSLSARMYVEQGMPPAVVQTLLGHSNQEMTQLYLNERGMGAAKFKRVEVPDGATTDHRQIEITAAT